MHGVVLLPRRNIANCRSGSSYSISSNNKTIHSIAEIHTIHHPNLKHGSRIIICPIRCVEGILSVEKLLRNGFQNYDRCSQKLNGWNQNHQPEKTRIISLQTASFGFQPLVFQVLRQISSNLWMRPSSLGLNIKQLQSIIRHQDLLVNATKLSPSVQEYKHSSSSCLPETKDSPNKTSTKSFGYVGFNPNSLRHPQVLLKSRTRYISLQFSWLCFPWLGIMTSSNPRPLKSLQPANAIYIYTPKLLHKYSL